MNLRKVLTRHRICNGLIVDRLTRILVSQDPDLELVGSPVYIGPDVSQTPADCLAIVMEPSDEP